MSDPSYVSDSHDFYQKYGYYHVKQFLNNDELNVLKQVLPLFHKHWLANNQSFYETSAVNSSGLTHKHDTPKEVQEALFSLIASNKLNNIAKQIFNADYAFMNTQLFFDPFDPSQKNYWHRDPQYHLTVEEQQQALQGPDVIHFRIATVDEPGIELVPESNKQWDDKLTLATRLEQNGRKNSDDLPNTEKIALEAGDLLIFSANMVHRGLYGNNRLSLDILLCEAVSSLAPFLQDKGLPEQSTLGNLQNPIAFKNTKKLFLQHG